MQSGKIWSYFQNCFTIILIIIANPYAVKCWEIKLSAGWSAYSNWDRVLISSIINERDETLTFSY